MTLQQFAEKYKYTEINLEGEDGGNLLSPKPDF